MTDWTARSRVGQPRGRTPAECRCHICTEDVLASDVTSIVTTHSGGLRVVHKACTKEGVERWCREGRPHRTPLLADRAEQWVWARRPPAAERPATPGEWDNRAARRRLNMDR